MIANSTESSSKKDKNLGHLAKLTLALKKNESFMRLSEITQETYSDVMSLNYELNEKGYKMIPCPPNIV